MSLSLPKKCRFPAPDIFHSCRRFVSVHDIPVCWRKAPFLILINASKPAFRFPCVQHSERDWSMKIGLIALGTVIAALAGPSASAQQVLNLSGQFRCVQGCIGPGPTYVTQNGWDLNLVNEVGQPSRAWIDWPGHIWAQYWNEGAVYSPDGMAIQFDRGSVWVRDLGPPPPPPPVHFRG